MGSDLVPRRVDTYLPLDASAERLFEQIRVAVRDELEPLTWRVVRQLRRVIPAYSGVAPEDLYAGVATDIAAAVDAVAAGRRATEDDLLASEQVGRQRAEQGLPVEALIRAFQVAAEETLAFAIAHGEQLGAGPRELLAFSRIGWSWANEAMTAAAQAHRQTELELARRDVRQRDELLRGIVLGSMPASEIQMRLPLYAMSPTRPYHVVRARALDEDRAGDALELLRRATSAGALTGTVDGDVVVVAARVPALPDGVTAGVGGPAPAAELHVPFDDASRALHSAWTFGLTGTHRLADLGLLPTVLSDHRIGETVSERCLGALSREERERLVQTLEVLLRHDLRISDAAEELFVHENTVRKRVRTFEDRTGLSLAKVDDVVAVWWALRYERARRPRAR